MNNVHIVVPAHNEEERIGPALESYLKYFEDLEKKKELKFKIIIVLNNCTDNTRKVIEEFNSKKIEILEFERAGKGFAITEGFKHSLKSDADLIGFVDADGATPPNAFYGLITNIKSADGIIANRWDKRSKIVKQTLLRRILSRGFNLIIRSLFLFTYEDTQCGAKLFKRKAIASIIDNLFITHWAFDINLLFSLKKKGFYVKSIPTEWIDKAGSKVNLKRTPLFMFLGALRLRLLNSPLRELIRFYDQMPNNLKIHHSLFN